tara:strand:+ start:522 stop:1265 length:744 start_codon:yes stop_codon:yes gene_type:complete
MHFSDKAKEESIISDEIYSNYYSEIERTSKKFTRDIVDIVKETKILLDIGCGTGLNANFLKEKGYEIYGIDVSQIAIDKFNKKGFKGKIMDISQTLKFEENFFDVVFASEVIEHVSYTEGFLKEVKRILKPGGILYLSTPNSSFWPYRVLSLLGFTLSQAQHKGHVRFFNKKSLLQTFKDNQFQIEKYCSRIMLVIIPFDFRVFKIFGFIREFRVKTDKFFWHLSFFVNKVSNFWSDTIILKAINLK